MGALGGLSMFGTGCDRDVGDVAVRIVRSSQAGENPFPDAVVDTVHARLEAADVGVREASEPYAAGQLVLPAVPTGEARVLHVEARSGERAVSRGRSAAFDFGAGVADVAVYVALAEQFSAAGGDAQVGGGAGVRAVRSGETVWLAGGGARPAVFSGASSLPLEAPPCAPVCDLLPQRGHAAAAHEDAVVLLGGEGADGTASFRCDPAGCVEMLDVRPWRRDGGLASFGARVLWAGGFEPSGPSVATTWVDIAAGTAERGPDLPRARAAPMVTAVGDRAVVLGGTNAQGDVVPGIVRVTDAEATVFAETYTRTDGVVVAVGEDAMLVIGGRAGASALDSIDVVYPGADLVCPAGTLRVPRLLAGAVALGDGRILVAGGIDAAGQPLRSAEIVQLGLMPRTATDCQAFEAAQTTLTSTLTDSMARARIAPDLVRVQGGATYVVGGVDGLGTGVSLLEVFMPAQNID